MPIIKSALKKLRKDKKRTSANKQKRDELKLAIKKAKRLHTLASTSAAVRLLDKAVKNNLIHKNKAARLKSKLAKNLPKTTPAKTKSAAKPKKPRKKA